MKPIKLRKLKKLPIKPVKVDVLQSLHSLQETAEKHNLTLDWARLDVIKKKLKKTEEEKEDDEPSQKVPRLRLKEISTLTEEVQFSSYHDKAITYNDLEENFKKNFRENRNKKEKEEFQKEVFSYLRLVFTKDKYSSTHVEDPEGVIASLGLKFCNEFEESHKRIHGSLAGIAMTKEIRDTLFDRILLFIEIKKTVDHHLRNHLAHGSQNFKEASNVFNYKFLDEIIESNRIFDKDQMERKLTGDNKLWISDCITMSTMS